MQINQSGFIYPKDPESIYLLQKLDCNCNECIFMERDSDKFRKWELWNREVQKQDFERRKAAYIKEVEGYIPYNERMVQKARNMPFQFDSSVLIHYGKCLKFDKPVSFIPQSCQVETQECFEHRKD